MHLTAVGRRLGVTPQTEQAAANQVLNNAGGFVFPVSEWTRLDRFLIIGTEKSYYQSTQTLTKENADALMQLIAKDGLGVVNRIVEISEQGRAPKQDYVIFALAACAGRGDLGTRRHALNMLPRVCRTGSMLLQFVSYIKQFRGWGRTLCDAVAEWYTEQPPDKLAYQLIKYQNRHNWTHRDVLRACHAPHRPLLRWAAGKEVALSDMPAIVTNYVATSLPDADKIALASVLPREALPTEWLQDASVWEALLMGGKGMPLTAMIRNLATMTRLGILKPGSKGAAYVVSKLRDQEHLHASRVHPAAILVALSTYRAGRGDKSKHTWIPTPEICAALDGAFYLAFKNVVPANKRIFIGLDVSGSMTTPMACMPTMSSREATTAMSLIQLATEPHVQIAGFTATETLYQLPFAPGQTIADCMAFTRNLPFASTDCSLPIRGALEQRLPFDLFVIYTDNETYAGRQHPFEALQQYRREMGIPAKLVVVGTTATNFSIADPRDAGMMDLCGFDSNMPALIADFARQEMGKV